MASGSSDGTVRLWELLSTKQNSQMASVESAGRMLITSVAISPDGSFVVSGTSIRSVKVHDGTTGSEISTLAPQTDITTDIRSPQSKWVASVAISSNNSCIAAGYYDQSVQLWNHESNTVLHVL